jgi:hypothetical protein
VLIWLINPACAHLTSFAVCFASNSPSLFLLSFLALISFSQRHSALTRVASGQKAREICHSGFEKPDPQDISPPRMNSASGRRAMASNSLSPSSSCWQLASPTSSVLTSPPATFSRSSFFLPCGPSARSESFPTARDGGLVFLFRRFESFKNSSTQYRTLYPFWREAGGYVSHESHGAPAQTSLSTTTRHTRSALFSGYPCTTRNTP